jgi:hypothetical protein
MQVMRSILAVLVGVALTGCTAIDDPFGWRIGSLDGGPDSSYDAAQGEVICTPGSEGEACASGSYFLCKGFEAGLTGSYEQVAGFDTTPKNPQTLVENWHGTAPACHGSGALHVQTVGSTQTAYIGYGFAPSVVPDPLYVRAFIYVDSSTTATDFSLIGVVDQLLSGSYHYMWLQWVDTGTLTLTGDQPLGAAAANFASGMQKDRWTCVEVSFSPNSPTQTVGISIDGVERAHYTGVPGFGASSKVNVGFGVTLSPATSDPNLRTSIYFDEVVLSSQPIGCQ